MTKTPDFAIATGTKVTPKQYSEATFCDPKSLRRVMRSMTSEQPGSGARWEIEIGSDFELALRNRISRTHNRQTVTASLKVSAD